MNLDTARQFRALLANSEWLTRTRAFATTLRTAGHQPGELLVVGTPDYEPWHFAAHLTDAARISGHPQLTPTLVRHHIPLGAAPHLAVDLTRLHAAGRQQTVLVIAPSHVPAELLNRIEDARRAGSTILAIDTGDPDLHTLAHDGLTVASNPNPNPNTPPARRDITRGQLSRSDAVGVAFDTAEHLITLCATDQPMPTRSWPRRRLDRQSRTLGGSGLSRWGDRTK
jgi:hypothetical protein